MTNKKEVAQVIWDTYINGYSKALMTPVEQFDTFIDSDSRKILADVLREVINQLSTTLPPDDNMDEFYARMYGGSESVVYVDEILEVCDELEAL